MPASIDPYDRPVLRVVDLDRDSVDDLIPLGLALHHFGDPMLDHVGASVELHHAVTVLTRQVRRTLEVPVDPLGAIHLLVVDPLRPATADGVPAHELCGVAWTAVERCADERAVAALAGAASYGTTPILRLAATRAAQTRLPWWGTPEWAVLVERAVIADSIPDDVRVTLLRTPEYVDLELLRRVLDGRDRLTVR